MTMSDRIAVMKDGLTHQIAAPDEIYNHPATAFVASFIGDMNFVHGTVLDNDGSSCILDVESQKVTARRAVDLDKGAEALVCIRTERVQINPHRNVENSVSAQLSRIVYRGTDYEATCRLGESELRAVVQAVAWDAALREGDTVQVAWNAEDVIVFPREEEKDVIKYSAEAV
jgi:ABC-type Fe3+/spermidine/putrescine transport system ATPase subunit